MKVGLGTRNGDRVHLLRDEDGRVCFLLYEAQVGAMIVKQGVLVMKVTEESIQN